MKRLLATIATIWRLAAPDLRSEDRWPGRLLLASVIAAELGLVAINVLLNEWNNRFTTPCRNRNWDAFVHESRIFCALAVLHPRRRLPALSQSMAASGGGAG